MLDQALRKKNPFNCENMSKTLLAAGVAAGFAKKADSDLKKAMKWTQSVDEGVITQGHAVLSTFAGTLINTAVDALSENIRKLKDLGDEYNDEVERRLGAAAAASFPVPHRWNIFDDGWEPTVPTTRRSTPKWSYNQQSNGIIGAWIDRDGNIHGGVIPFSVPGWDPTRNENSPEKRTGR
jgi:hypothetical protein